MKHSVNCRAVEAALEHESRINLHQHRIDVECIDGIVRLRGEVGTIVAKRLAARIARSIPGVDGVDDELRVQPTEKRGDNEIVDAVVKTIMSEPVFRDYVLLKQVHHSEPIDGKLIIVYVNDAVVRLVGQVESLTHKRLADVLVWWTSGVADVDNRLRVAPGQKDTDNEINDSLRIVLEKDPSLNPDEIRTEARDHVIYLNGVVHNETEKELAERDAWCILGVHEVTNALEVRR